MKISGFVEYVKQIWKNKPDTSTPVSAERLNHIEEGIKANSDALAALAAVVCDQVLNDPEKIASLAALYSVDKKIGNTANLPNSAMDVVTALATLNSNLTKKVNSDDIALTDVKSKFTGSTNCIVEKAFKQGNIIQLYVTIKNISSGWTEFSLTTTYSIVSTAPGKIHKASSPDSTTELTCSFNGAKVIVLSANAVANGVSVQFDLMIR